MFLALETYRYRYAALYHPLLAMNTSKVDPLPHQIEAVYGYVLRLPRIRFLIADDPGAGKTIMAGLIIKELKLRNQAKRILIVAPGHLKDQWRRELKERFEEPFAIVDRGTIDAYYGENVWAREPQIITSIDFAKQDDVLSSLGSRVANTIFMYSFSGGTERGATLGEIKRNATTLDNPSSVVAESVEQVKGRLFYLQQYSAKYFFTNQPNLNRILLTRMENITREQIREVELDLLKKRVGGRRLKVFLWPTDSMDIPDTTDLKLVVLPDSDEDSARQLASMRGLMEERGGTPRVNRNTLFFLTPLGSERAGFENLVRETLAYRALRDDNSLTLTSDQRDEVKEKLKKADGDMFDSVRRVYRRLYVPSRNGLKGEDMGIATYGESKAIDEEVYDKLCSVGEILENIAPLVIKERYLTQGREYVSTEQLYQAGLRTPGESRAVSQEVWNRGIAEGVRKGLFGIGELRDGQPHTMYYKEEPSVSLTGGEVLIREDVAQYHVTPPVVVTPPDGNGGTAGTTTPDSGQGGGTGAHGGSGGQPSGGGSGAGTGASEQGALTLRLTVPKGKVASLMGVMNLLQSRFSTMQVTLHVEGGQLSEQEYEDKVMETFRQMGVDVEAS
ncbi:MAG: DEAD/DEAH box helicase family protein [Chloroflexota bacterium]|nr:DEAD/DEAH box helicase family protein [Chloroflexota bacterium]